MKDDLALVMSGGGARAAYQVGFLRYLARNFKGFSPQIITGVSAGAINAAHLANRSAGFETAVEQLAALWDSLSTDDVYRSDWRSLSVNFAKWGYRLGTGGSPPTEELRGLVDTGPLQEFLCRHLASENGILTSVQKNINNNDLQALAITTTNYTTGQTVTWVQGRDIRAWERPNRRGMKCEMSIGHIMASSALPLYFPAVQIDGQWYGDGGIRLATPLAPAVHLGAERIIAISTRYGASAEEADAPVIVEYPPPAQIIGTLMNAVFLDHLDQDAMILERINRLVEYVPEEKRWGLRPIRLLVLRPSVDLAKMAASFQREQPALLRLLMRGLGSHRIKRPDWLSMVLFERAYIKHMMDVGEKDADARAGEIEAILS